MPDIDPTCSDRFAPRFAAGDRVAIAPHCDAFMQGDRYGEVIGEDRPAAAFAIGVPPVYSVRLDRSGRVRRFAQANLELA